MLDECENSNISRKIKYLALEKSRQAKGHQMLGTKEKVQTSQGGLVVWFQ